MKKAAKKAKESGKKAIKKERTEQDGSDKDPFDSTHDFGGLPDRDLKKGLGCG